MILSLIVIIGVVLFLIGQLLLVVLDFLIWLSFYIPWWLRKNL